MFDLINKTILLFKCYLLSVGQKLSIGDIAKVIKIIIQ